MIKRILFIIIFLPLVILSCIQIIYLCIRWVVNGKNLYDTDLIIVSVGEKLFDK